MLYRTLMISQIQPRYYQKMAYVYLRQSTMGQVCHHQESTARQYALKDRALSLGWQSDQIRVLDADLGFSGTQTNNREDFKTLVADVSLEKVGALFALEASRLSRSCSDWHRLLEICALTATLLVDEDGCYDPADFNDQLLLGLKGTMSQAELHSIRARLQGGKRNKARRGELRFPLPVGYVYGEEPGSVLIDPDQEVCRAVAHWRDLSVDLPLPMPERLRYSETILTQVRTLGLSQDRPADCRGAQSAAIAKRNRQRIHQKA